MTKHHIIINALPKFSIPTKPSTLHLPIFWRTTHSTMPFVVYSWRSYHNRVFFLFNFIWMSYPILSSSFASFLPSFLKNTWCQDTNAQIQKKIRDPIQSMTNARAHESWISEHILLEWLTWSLSLYTWSIVCWKSISFSTLDPMSLRRWISFRMLSRWRFG